MSAGIDTFRAVARVLEARRTYDEMLEAAELARLELAIAMREAHAQGVTNSTLSAAAGIGRTHVGRMLKLESNGNGFA